MWPPGHGAWGPGEGLAVSRQKASSGCPLALDTFWPSPPIEVQGIKEGFSSEGQIHFDPGFPTLCPLVCCCTYQVPGHSKCLALFSRVKESQGLNYVQVGKVAEVPSQVPQHTFISLLLAVSFFSFCSSSPGASPWGPGHFLPVYQPSLCSSGVICFLHLRRLPSCQKGTSCSIALSADGCSSSASQQSESHQGLLPSASGAASLSCRSAPGSARSLNLPPVPFVFSS